jgi:hypothetical protein
MQVNKDLTYGARPADGRLVNTSTPHDLLTVWSHGSLGIGTGSGFVGAERANEDMSGVTLLRQERLIRTQIIFFACKENAVLSSTSMTFPSQPHFVIHQSPKQKKSSSITF